MTQQHVLEVYEPYDYTGENPLPTEGVAVLPGPSRENYYLVRLLNPLNVDEEIIELLLVSPHYNGDKIDRAVSSTCTVNIARVAAGVELDQDNPLHFTDLLRWGVGKISPWSPH